MVDSASRITSIIKLSCGHSHPKIKWHGTRADLKAILKEQGPTTIAFRHGEKTPSGVLSKEGLERGRKLYELIDKEILPEVSPDTVGVIAANGADDYGIPGEYGTTSRTSETVKPMVIGLAGDGVPVEENLIHSYRDIEFLKNELGGHHHPGHLKIVCWEHEVLGNTLGFEWPSETFDLLVVVKNGKIHVLPQQLDVNQASPTEAFTVSSSVGDLHLRVMTSGQKDDTPALVVNDAPSSFMEDMEVKVDSLLTKGEQVDHYEHPLFKVAIGWDGCWYKKNGKPLPILSSSQWADAYSNVLGQMGVEKGMVLARGFGAPIASRFLAINPHFSGGVVRQPFLSQADFIAAMKELQKGAKEERLALAAFIKRANCTDYKKALFVYHERLKQYDPIAIRDFTLLTEALIASTKDQRDHYLKILANPDGPWNPEGQQRAFRFSMQSSALVALGRSAMLQDSSTHKTPDSLRVLLEDVRKDLGIADDIIREIGVIIEDVRKVSHLVEILTPVAWLPYA